MGHKSSTWYALAIVLLVGSSLVVACGGMEQTVIEVTEEYYEPAPAVESEVEPEPAATDAPISASATPPPAGTEEAHPVATSPSVTQVPSTPSVAERLRDIDRALQDTMEGALAYDAPTTMDLNEVEEVRLLLDLGQSPEQLVTVLEAEHDEQAAAARQMEGAVINITDQMKAELVSRDPDALSVEPLRDSMQFIGTGEPTEWKWLLKPRQGGQHTLYLVVSRLVQYGDDESWRLVEEYETSLDVTVTTANRLASYARTIVDEYLLQLILFPVIVSLIVALILKRIDNLNAR